MSSCTVCILTAGKGTRLGGYSAALNKALLPLDKKAVITRIIEKFPKDSEFVIGLGHLGEQVRTYLELAHPQTKFIFVEVDRYEGPGSGPGYSLSCCSEHLQRPFYFIACDTLVESELDLELDHDWFGVAEVKPEVAMNYCNFELDTDNRVVAIHDKKSMSGPRYRAFIGLCYIKNYETFWSGLGSATMIQGEHQISSGLSALVKEHAPYARQMEWLDVGDAEKYRAAVAHFDNFDFAKENEALYIVNRRVVKYFADHRVADKRVERARQNSSAFPEVSDALHGFYTYQFMTGRTLYEFCTPQIFEALLGWLSKDFWKKVSVPTERMHSLCRKFYHDKTIERVAAYLRKYPSSGHSLIINETPVPDVSSLLARVPWEQLEDGKPVIFHGDLQFDNVLYDEARRVFTLLDWRQDFAGETSCGDLYYDLAKLLGGIRLNYDFIKKNLFTFLDFGDRVYFDFARRFQEESYIAKLHSFTRANGLSWAKVRLLVPLIYLNMSPLHHFPFDRLLYSMGLLFLKQELDALDRPGHQDIHFSSSEAR